MNIDKIRHFLSEEQLDGWLLYDFRRSNPLALQVLGIAPETMLTRRLAYWIPAKGVVVKIVNRIEEHHLDHLPGEKMTYGRWQEYEQAVKEVLQGQRKVAMEYSPGNAIPYVSKVDGGTIDLVRSFDVEVASSADLLQQYVSVWDEEKLALHREASAVAQQAVDDAWQQIRNAMQTGKSITEWDVQQFILQSFSEGGCTADGGPICAVNAHAADPHYVATAESAAPITDGDVVLIDLWCKRNAPRATYADLCRMGVVAAAPTGEQKKVFDTVYRALQEALKLIEGRFGSGERIEGWEADQAARKVIEEAGYGDYFIHRLGHNIDEQDHGDGAHLDNYETQDRRALIPRTCFSIEPGIYLPGKFGVRLETDVYIHSDGKVEVTGGLQDAFVCL